MNLKTLELAPSRARPRKLTIEVNKVDERVMVYVIMHSPEGYVLASAFAFFGPSSRDAYLSNGNSKIFNIGYSASFHLTPHEFAVIQRNLTEYGMETFIPPRTRDDSIEHTDRQKRNHAAQLP